MGTQSLSGTERAKVCIRYGVYPNTGWRPVACYWCGGTDGKLAWSLTGKQTAGWSTGWDLEFDHLVPLSLGGANTAENTVLACRWCNRSRCNRLEPSSAPGRYV